MITCRGPPVNGSQSSREWTSIRYAAIYSGFSRIIRVTHCFCEVEVARRVQSLSTAAAAGTVGASVTWYNVWSSYSTFPNSCKSLFPPRGWPLLPRLNPWLHRLLWTWIKYCNLSDIKDLVISHCLDKHEVQGKEAVTPKLDKKFLSG